MPKVRPDAPYDPKNLDSVLDYASKLQGMTVGEIHLQSTRHYSPNNKGAIGQIIENGYFKIDPNNDHKPDLEDLGIEIKTTGVMEDSGRLQSKERLSLSTINYMEIAEESFEESFLTKCGRMLVIFYKYEEGKEYDDFEIVKVVLWTFPEIDLDIIRKDWDYIQGKVLEGHAEQLSGKSTEYLEAAPKGPGGGKYLRPQPYSKVKVKPRGFALKQGYVNNIFNSKSVGQSIFPNGLGYLFNSSLIESVLLKFKPFEGMEFKDLENLFAVKYKVGDKARYARMARMMLGIKSMKVAEFEKSNILMKAVRVNEDGSIEQSMSFPFFKYEDLLDEEWEESGFYAEIDRKFLFVIFEKKDSLVFFNKAFFWKMPQEDMDECHKVWMEARKLAKQDYFGNISKTFNPVAHVRPHSTKKNDTYLGSDGRFYEKKCFWLNNTYLEKIVCCSVRSSS